MSAPRCRPGDLAVIVRSQRLPSNIGKVVRIVRPAIDGEDYAPWPDDKGYLFTWMVEATGSSLRVEYEDGTEGDDNEAFCTDRSLRPIRPDGELTAGDITRPEPKATPQERAAAKLTNKALRDIARTVRHMPAPRIAHVTECAAEWRNKADISLRLAAEARANAERPDEELAREARVQTLRLAQIHERMAAEERAKLMTLFVPSPPRRVVSSKGVTSPTKAARSQQ